jgi:hypothetical protein
MEFYSADIEMLMSGWNTLYVAVAMVVGNWRCTAGVQQLGEYDDPPPSISQIRKQNSAFCSIAARSGTRRRICVTCREQALHNTSLDRRNAVWNLV